MKVAILYIFALLLIGFILWGPIFKNPFAPQSTATPQLSAPTPTYPKLQQIQGVTPPGFIGPTEPPHIIGPSGPPPNY